MIMKGIRCGLATALAVGALAGAIVAVHADTPSPVRADSSWNVAPLPTEPPAEPAPAEPTAAPLDSSWN